MNLNFFEKLENAVEKTLQKQKEIENIKVQGIDNEEIELAQKLDAIEEYVIDRFEENIVVIEDRKTGKMKNIEKNVIPQDCKEGDVLKCINGKYFLDKEETNKIEDEIKEKYNNLWE